MDEESFFLQDDHWEAGFEGDRRIVVSRLGPFVRVFPRPKHLVPRFYHNVHELGIQDWALPIEPIKLGSFCTIGASITIRFQPTLRYAREHLEFLPKLHSHIKASHEALLKDAVEQELRKMERDASWLQEGYAHIEKNIECAMNELLAIRNIQCRARCLIEPSFTEIDESDTEALAPWSRHKTIYLALLRRKREASQRIHLETTEQLAKEQRLRLEREAKLLELMRQENELLKARRAEEIAKIQAELTAEETRLAEQRHSEARLREEQIRHDARLREMEMDADFQEKDRRAQTMDDMENHLKREIELLAMERQRLLLEQEVREVKVARAKGWIINAKKRFPLGENKNLARDAELPEPPSED
ncbi:MAG TPA: hypothetical protein VLU73_13380 [Methylococcaceae bacterium]|jgi:hypothetical protein|nr:hypothetical protein [Methylococcaceae bacterium]